MGFVLVAVLCAVLMAMSVGRGFGVDLIRPGKPISTPPARAQAEPPAEAPAARPTVSIPDELSSRPYAVVGSGGTAQQTDAQQSDTTTDRAATRAERKAALRALREAVKAERAAAKAEREAAKDATKAGRKG